MRVMVVAAVFLSACAQQLSRDSFCTELLRAQCEKEKRCGTVSTEVDCGQYQSLNDCYLDAQIAFDAKKVKYDGAAALQCVATIKDEACNLVTGESMAARSTCGAIFVGQRRSGEPCGGCANGLYCVRETATSCGTCRQLPEASGLRTVGETCSYDSQQIEWCGRGAFCSFSEKVCVRRGQRGDSCGSGSTPCDDRFTCNGTICIERSEYGGACVYQDDCLTGLLCAESTCLLQLGVGSACSDDVQCLGSFCAEGVCSLSRPLGAACNTFVPSCGARAFCDEDTARCTALPRTGEACDVRYGCDAVEQCIDGTCRDVSVGCY